MISDLVKQTWDGLSIVILVQLLLLAKAEETDKSVEEILAGGEDVDEDYIQHEVTRVEFEESEDSDEDEYDYDDYDEEEDGEFDEAPYKRYQKWQRGWIQHPLYVIIVGG